MPHTLPSISMTIPALDDRTASPLPPIGHDISRPPSTSTAPSEKRASPGREQAGEKVTLPSLSTLAKVASEGSPPHSYPPASGPQHSHTYSNASPTPTSVAGQGNVPPVCQNCQTSTTPLWRRDEAGSVLCNACGLFLKLHGRARPISLKTDVIKSRNRVKSSAQSGRRKMQFGAQPPPHHADLSTPPPHPSYRRVTDQHMPAYSDRSASPISRAGTPSSLHPHHTHPGHHPHTAPPLTHHLFDPSLARSPSPMPPHGAQYHHSQSAPSTIAHRVTSPRPHAPTLPLPVPTVNGHAHAHAHAHAHSPSTTHAPPPRPPPPPPPPGAASTAELQTRISELEVINALYKGQLQDMEVIRKKDADTIAYLQRENEELRRSALHMQQQQQQQQQQQLLHHQPRPATTEPAGHQHIPPPPPEPKTEPPVDYATATGSMKRRRGRTLEKVGEESKPYGSKRRETGEFPRPELAAVRV